MTLTFVLKLKTPAAKRAVETATQVPPYCHAAYLTGAGWHIRGSYSGLRWNALTERHKTEDEAWAELARNLGFPNQEDKAA